MMYRVLILSCLISLIGGCNQNPVESDPPAFIGTWKLLRTYGGMGGGYTDSDSVHYTISFDVSGTHRRYWNHYMYVDSKYTVERKLVYTEVYDVLEYTEYDGVVSAIMQRVDSDTLSLLPIGFDTQTEIYVRMR